MAVTTQERPLVRAQVRYARVSPSKVREVLKLIRGRGVRAAEEALALSERDPAELVAKCLASAVANAEHNNQIEESELFVAECYCDEGPTLKRWRPRARGRATRINKRTSHLTIVLGRYTADELQAIDDREAARGSGGGRRDASEERRRRVAKSRGEDVEAADEDEVDTTEAEDREVDEPTEAEAEAVEEIEAEQAEEAEDVEPDTGDDDVPSAEELVADNTKDELLAMAEQAGVTVAKSANKSTIAEAIVAGRGGADEGDA